jgi:hypothetical protein
MRGLSGWGATGESTLGGAGGGLVRVFQGVVTAIAPGGSYSGEIVLTLG